MRQILSAVLLIGLLGGAAMAAPGITEAVSDYLSQNFDMLTNNDYDYFAPHLRYTPDIPSPIYNLDGTPVDMRTVPNYKTPEGGDVREVPLPSDFSFAPNPYATNNNGGNRGPNVPAGNGMGSMAGPGGQVPASFFKT